MNLKNKALNRKQRNTAIKMSNSNVANEYHLEEVDYEFITGDIETVTPTVQDIDFGMEPQITITQLMFDKEFNRTFIARVTGMSVNYVIMNTMRRCILSLVPAYGFNRDDIFIDNSNTKVMYNNDMLKTELLTVKVPFVDNNFTLENPMIYFSNPALRKAFVNHYPRIDQADSHKTVPAATSASAPNGVDKHVLNIEVHFSVSNSGHETNYLTTREAKLIIDGVEVDNFQRAPRRCLCKIKPGEYVNLKMKASLGIPLFHATYETTTNTTCIEYSAAHLVFGKQNIKEPSPYPNGDEIVTLMNDDFIIYYEDLLQLDGGRIFNKAASIIKAKLLLIHAYLLETKTVAENMEFYGENDTLGNLLTTTFQLNPNVYMAQYKVVEHDMKIAMYVKLVEKSTISLYTLWLQCLQYLAKLFTIMEKFKFKPVPISF